MNPNPAQKAPASEASAPKAKPEHIKAAVDRANDMLNRARLVNAGQYAHGINSTCARVEWILRNIESGKSGAYGDLHVLQEKVMQLGGYLYALREGIT